MSSDLRGDTSGSGFRVLRTLAMTPDSRLPTADRRLTTGDWRLKGITCPNTPAPDS